MESEKDKSEKCKRDIIFPFLVAGFSRELDNYTYYIFFKNIINNGNRSKKYIWNNEVCICQLITQKLISEPYTTGVAQN